MVRRIFLVEDDPKIREELSTLLGRYGYESISTENFEDVPGQILAAEAHLVLLDLNLPRYDGYHICRELRKCSEIPIVVVTSRDTELDELMSMNLGADDFIAKPYHPMVLLARLDRLLRRAYPSAPAPELVCRGVKLDLGRSAVCFDGREEELTRNEGRLLHCLMKHQGQVVSRDTLMNELWQSDEFVDDNTLTVNINRLRRKLENLGLHDFLVTRRGQGYQV